MSYKTFQFSQGAVEQVSRDIKSGASDEFVKQYFKDDPEMLDFVTEQQAKRQAMQSDSSTVSQEAAQA